VFIVLIIVISLSYKKYGLQHDETNSNWGFPSLNGHLAKGEMFSFSQKISSHRRDNL
jgi:hypothetical protein